MTVIRFFMQLRSQLAHHQPMAKFLAFKLVVTLTFLENVSKNPLWNPTLPPGINNVTNRAPLGPQIIFWILRDTGSLNAISTLSWADLRIGIPSMLICIEMLPLAAFFHHAYSHRPYVIGSGNVRRPLAGDLEAYEPQSYSGGPAGLWALVEMWNPMEIVEALRFGLQLKMEERKQQRSQKGWEPAREQQASGDEEMTPR